MASNEEASQSSYCYLCSWFWKEPKFLFRTIFLALGLVLSIVLITTFAFKLRITADGTNLHIEVNQTLFYPAITFCQEPPFAKLDANVGVPEVIQIWEENNAKAPNNVTFLDFISDVAFSQDEVDSVKLGKNQDFKVSTTFTFIHGQCHTYIPQTPVYRVGKRYGYNISLTYDKDIPKDDTPVGWHIYIHDSEHDFHDHCTADGRADYYFLNVGEVVEAKIKPMRFERHGDCNNEATVAECYQICVYKKLIQRLECQAPWMNFEGVELCPYDDETFSYLIYFSSPNNSYINEQACKCPRVCSFTNFGIFVEKVSKVSIRTPKRSQLAVYYTTNAIMVAEEHSLYDMWSFIADVSAVLAFFLGFSLLSIGATIERACRIMFCPNSSANDENCSSSGGGSRRTSMWPTASSASSYGSNRSSVEDFRMVRKPKTNA